MAGNGSPLYALTWRQWDMPAGPPICALRARARPISGNDCFSGRAGWTTPLASDVRKRGPGNRVNPKGGGADLNWDAEAAGWPTARETDGEKNVRSAAGAAREMARKGGPQDMAQAATLAGGEYADPDKAMARAMGPHSNDLRDFAQMAGWPTPMAGTPARGGNSEAGNTDASRRTAALCGAEIAGHGLSLPAPPPGPARFTADGRMLTGSSAAMPSGGRLNPAHSRWLMGYPPAWCDCAVTAMRSSRRSRRGS